MQEEKKFDSILKSALEHYEAPFDASSWDLLEQKMGRTLFGDATDPETDQQYRRVLSQLEAPFEQAHWEQMSNRLDAEHRLRRRIWVLKLAEAAVFLLLFGYLDGMRSNSGTNDTQAGHLEGPVASVASGAQKHRAGRQVRTHSPAHSKPTAGSVFVLQPFTSGQSISAIDPLQLVIVSSESKEASLLDPVPVLSGEIPMVHFLPQSVQPSPVAVFQKKAESKMGSRFYALAFGAWDRNMVKLESDTRQVNGTEGGLAIGYRKGKWGIEGGIGYSQKTFQPKLKVEIYSGNVNNGYYGAYIQEVSAHLVAIPVHLNRQLGKLGRWNLSAVGGTTAQFAAKKQYKTKTIYYPGLSQSTIPGGNTGPKTLKAGRGTFENGSIADNFYLSADAGLRIERKVGSRAALFLEPMLQGTLTRKGIGPDPSRIHTLSLRAGVIASL